MSDLLQEMLDAAGGLDRWQRVETIVVQGEMGGMVLDLKSDFDPNPVRTAVITAGAAGLTVTPYLDDQTRGVFGHDFVRIESLDGQVKGERHKPRDYFLRWPGKWRRFFKWDSLDVLYFAGYAIWNYFNTPFFLAGEGFVTEEIEPWTDEDGKRFRRLRASFPPGVHTHGRDQVFFVNTEGPEVGLVHHFQYTAEILGSWAHAVHFTSEYRDYDGLRFPSVRRALLRDDVYLRKLRQRWYPRSMAMWGDLSSVVPHDRVDDGDAPAPGGP